ncbi:hypothetical protein SAMN04489867_0406 [Pedococcus dokdonensis]|uniref:Uncharacterized protein n=1 Tax=Pedococcus dokdonensis TaxID=443156 RepID=A0A1H0LV37_9MICO|nr:hypothetical protein [Pedococcus dokdonensis]SDO71931.1 hypothetical protein SAMN04489867_0406 [Pedococcus dokdonensis]
MSDYIALTINSNAGASLARSARPDAPVVDDGFTTRPSRRAVRSSFATTLRTAAAAQRRWADRIDPACAPVRA